MDLTVSNYLSDDRPVEESSNVPTKREVKGARRVRNACLQCRERKIRCSRTYPCKLSMYLSIISRLYLWHAVYFKAHHPSQKQVEDVFREAMEMRAIGRVDFPGRSLSHNLILFETEPLSIQPDPFSRAF